MSPEDDRLDVPSSPARPPLAASAGSKVAIPGEESSRPAWKLSDSHDSQPSQLDSTPPSESSASVEPPPTVALPPGSKNGLLIADPPAAPPRVGRYRLDQQIGRGGMGAVWLGFDPRLGRQVAIKVLRSDHRQEPAAIAEFLEEGRCLARLNHPDILPVYDCGIDDGVCYLVSEFVAGGTLADYLRRQSPSFQEAAALVARIAEAAHYAHFRGIVHRDIKPGNILMRESGKPVLADFGLAIAEQDQLKSTPGTVGTYAYMSPEQLRGDSQFVDGRADIYSLGAILYELLTGRRPFLAGSLEAYRELVLKGDARPPRSVREDIPPALEAICLKCLARSPLDRYTTAADLAAALRAQARPPRQPRRRAFAALLAGTVLLASLLAGGLAYVAWKGPGHAEPSAVGASVAEAAAPAITARQPVARQVDAAARGVTQWEVTDGGATLRCLSDELSLFRIGQHAGEDLAFSVQLEQRTLDGQLGVYWGGRDVAGEPGWQVLECLQVYPGDDRQLRLRLVRLKFNPTANHLTRTTELAFCDLPNALGAAHRLGFEIRRGQLARLQWDDVDLSAMLKQRSAKTVDGPPLGDFGLIGMGAHGRFCRPQLNGQQTRFELPADDPLP